MDLAVVAFQVQPFRYALPLAAVDRVLSMVEITPLPSAPSVVSGLINVAGIVTPVLDIRRRLGAPRRGPSLEGRLVLARSRKRALALEADTVDGVMMVDRRSIAAASSILPGIGQVEGVVAAGDGFILIQDIEAFLSPTEEWALDDALRELQA